MKKNNLRQTLCPILAALIWGTSFVAQSVSTDYIGAFTFNAARSVIGALAIFVVLAVVKLIQKKQSAVLPVKDKKYNKKLIMGGIFCGIMLTVASYLQQLGLSDTSAGKAGFITALYIVLVPIFGIFLHKKAPLSVWISVIIAVFGLYLLCIKENFTISKGDFYVLLCAFAFTGHILIIDYFTQFVNGVELSFIQFITVSVLSSICAFIFEKPQISELIHCIGPLLYCGILSSGVGYTLQIIAQKDANPTVVSLLLSLESVFATLSGALILNEKMSVKEYIGCILMFLAVLLAQLPDKLISNINKKNSYSQK